MAEATIPVDLRNPGQVFGCLGLVEAADVLLGEARGAFQWTRSASDSFLISAAGDDCPVVRVMQFLDQAQVTVLMPPGAKHRDKWKPKWGTLRETGESEPFPMPDPPSPASLPVVLSDGRGQRIPIDHWGDATRRDNMKFWGGAGGYPGGALLLSMLDRVRDRCIDSAFDPFQLSAPLSSSFRFDPRRDYVPVQLGFSLNSHRKGAMVPVGFPLVEILAAIGLTHARPRRRDTLEYSYGVPGGEPLEPVLLRAALGSHRSPVPGALFRRYLMRLDWPGKSGQARCVTYVMKQEFGND